MGLADVPGIQKHSSQAVKLRQELRQCAIKLLCAHHVDIQQTQPGAVSLSYRSHYLALDSFPAQCLTEAHGHSSEDPHFFLLTRHGD